jgi:hypothetical protein
MITDEQYSAAQAITESGGTKKAACEALGIRYNTKRLDTLLMERGTKERVERELRAKKRTQPVTKVELAGIITDYLNGASFENLSSWYFRSSEKIKTHIELAGALMRHISVDPLSPPLLPDACVATEFADGEYVWSAKYNCIAKVSSKYKNAYAIWVLSEGVQKQSYQAAEELGSLKHLEAIGVVTNKLGTYIDGTDAKNIMVTALRESRKKKK